MVALLHVLRSLFFLRAKHTFLPSIFTDAKGLQIARCQWEISTWLATLERHARRGLCCWNNNGAKATLYCHVLINTLHFCEWVGVCKWWRADEHVDASQLLLFFTKHSLQRNLSENSAMFIGLAFWVWVTSVENVVILFACTKCNGSAAAVLWFSSQSCL